MRAWLSLALLCSACSDRVSDAPADAGAPNALGLNFRIRQIQDPASPQHAAHESAVRVSGAVVTHIDTFDETRDGRSRGTIYIQDADAVSLPEAQRAFSGISLFSPAFVPSDLRPQAGDVLDFNGTYQENASIGTAVFPAGQKLTQLARPVGVFRFDLAPPAPTVIDVNDLLDYAAKGQRWVGMLVTVKNVTIVGPASADARGRVTAIIAGEDPEDRNAPVVSNEFFDLKGSDVPQGKVFESITGVCTYFFNLKIAPRSAADLVPAK